MVITDVQVYSVRARASEGGDLHSYLPESEARKLTQEVCDHVCYNLFMFALCVSRFPDPHLAMH